MLKITYLALVQYWRNYIMYGHVEVVECLWRSKDTTWLKHFSFVDLSTPWSMSLFYVFKQIWEIIPLKLVISVKNSFNLPLSSVHLIPFDLHLHHHLRHHRCKVFISSSYPPYRSFHVRFTKFMSRNYMCACDIRVNPLELDPKRMGMWDFTGTKFEDHQRLVVAKCLETCPSTSFSPLSHYSLQMPFKNPNNLQTLDLTIFNG